MAAKGYYVRNGQKKKEIAKAAETARGARRVVKEAESSSRQTRPKPISGGRHGRGSAPDLDFLGKPPARPECFCSRVSPQSLSRSRVKIFGNFWKFSLTSYYGVRKIRVWSRRTPKTKTTREEKQK